MIILLEAISGMQLDQLAGSLRNKVNETEIIFSDDSDIP